MPWLLTGEMGQNFPNYHVADAKTQTIFLNLSKVKNSKLHLHTSNTIFVSFDCDCCGVFGAVKTLLMVWQSLQLEVSWCIFHWIVTNESVMIEKVCKMTQCCRIMGNLFVFLNLGKWSGAFNTVILALV